MTLEYKTFTVVYGAYDESDIISHREAFGWKREESGRNSVTMQRDTSIENYEQLKKIEARYDVALEKYKLHKNKLRTGLLEDWQLFVLWAFILPGILFLCYKKHHKNKAENSLKIASELVDEARTIVITSKAE